MSEDPGAGAVRIGAFIAKATRRKRRGRGTRIAKLAPTSHLPSEYSFEDSCEEQYFRGFCDNTSTSISGGFESPLWKRLILQACRNEPTILQFAVAISALDQACREKESDCMSRKPEEHHQYALQKYGNALKGVQKVISARKDPMRLALIASLLIFCFENFHGDIQNAISNIKSAVEFMYSWLEKQAHNSKFKVFSPAPILVEDELVITFFRLARYMILFQGRLEDKYPKAKKSLDPFGPSSPKRGHITKSAESAGWSSAFAPVLAQSRTPDGDEQFVTATTLHVECMVILIDLRRIGLSGSGTTAYDSFLPEFRELLSLCRAVIKHPRFVKSFVLDVGIVSYLFMVFLRCRDEAVRRSAISLLKMASPRREAFWDSALLAKTAERVMALEKRGAAEFSEAWKVEVWKVRVDEYELDFTHLLLEDDQEAEEEKEWRPTIGSGIPGWDSQEKCMDRWATFRENVRR
ncbi:hypothetical protein LAWI1_G003879 [Lachnellula willkommii]|uniref:Uncharacterized protein n=1 Tax=Lachnellula willkommii TaxID=215461 RepID=A0A559MFL1_9HELO|nr:hypothetical protein LAWI1_G003879 [Lachnellula willkommii]